MEWVGLLGIGSGKESSIVAMQHMYQIRWGQVSLGFDDIFFLLECGMLRYERLYDMHGLSRGLVVNSKDGREMNQLKSTDLFSAAGEIVDMTHRDRLSKNAPPGFRLLLPLVNGTLPS